MFISNSSVADTIQRLGLRADIVIQDVCHGVLGHKAAENSTMMSHSEGYKIHFEKRLADGERAKRNSNGIADLRGRIPASLLAGALQPTSWPCPSVTVERSL
jgi:hypothetical protein